MHERQGWPQSIRWRSCLAVVRTFHAMESAVGIPSSHRVGSPFTVGKRCLDESVAGDCRWGHLFCARGGSGRRCDTNKKKMRLELFGRSKVWHLTNRWSEPLTGAKIYFR